MGKRTTSTVIAFGFTLLRLVWWWFMVMNGRPMTYPKLAVETVMNKLAGGIVTFSN